MEQSQGTSWMLLVYKIPHPVLQRIARVVDEADTVQDVICRGIRLTSPDDQLALDRGQLIYDAFYARFAREAAEAAHAARGLATLCR
jgi:hypothetical protein